MTDLRVAAARLLKTIQYSIESPAADRSDISMLSARVLKLKSDDEDLTNLVHALARSSLLWSYYRDNPVDQQNLYHAAHKVLRALEPEGQ